MVAVVWVASCDAVNDLGAEVENAFNAWWCPRRLFLAALQVLDHFVTRLCDYGSMRQTINQSLPLHRLERPWSTRSLNGRRITVSQRIYRSATTANRQSSRCSWKVLGTRRKTLHPSSDRVFHQHDRRVSASSAAQEGQSQEEDDATKLASQVRHAHMLVSKLCVVPLTLANMSRLPLVCYRLEVVWAQAVLQ